MAESPNENADAPLHVSIRCGGADQPQLPLISVTVRHDSNTNPWARLVLVDGDMATQRFPLSDGELFKPGSEIVVKAGHGGEEAPIFSGIVLRHGIRIDGQNDSRLVVECQGLAQDRPSLRSSAAALTLGWGVDLISFEADIDAGSQWAAHGRMSFQGSALARPGALVELAGVGERFSGPVLLSAVEHEISAGNWISRAEFGPDPQQHAQPAKVMAPPTDDPLPRVNGLQIGVVLQRDGDPANEQRVLVTLPGLLPGGAGMWARLAQFPASQGFSAFFLPEVGDAVVLGHVNNDLNQPVVLGSLYGGMHQPSGAGAAASDSQAIVTRCGHRIEFNDRDQIITITTPARNRLVLDDAAQGILLQDQHGNSLSLSAAGIVLSSPKDIHISAKGGLSAKGGATAELSAAGQTTIQGGMVLIN
jgi:uncharacterized protein involved in type VI secretion and phage assembly